MMYNLYIIIGYIIYILIFLLIYILEWSEIVYNILDWMFSF